MNHWMMLTNSPSLWLGAMTFRSNRLDIYDSLIAKLDPEGRSSTQTVTEVFDAWAIREHKRGDTLGHVFTYVQRKTAMGVALSEALKPFIDNDEHLILVGGEIKGDLLDALKAMRSNVEVQGLILDIVLSEMWVPLLGILGILGLSVGLGLFLWPDFVRSIPEKFWPGWAIPCIRAQLWLGKNWPVVSLLALAYVAYSTTVDRWTGRAREVLDHLPPWSVYKGRIAANTLGTLAALIGSGMSVREALIVLRDHSAPYLGWQLDRIIRRYDDNEDDGVNALRTGLFSVRMMDRIEDASAGRSFDETLRDVGTRSMAMVIRALRAQVVVVSAICFFVVGILFTYITVVTAFGIQDASDAQIAALNRSGSGTRP